MRSRWLMAAALAGLVLTAGSAQAQPPRDASQAPAPAGAMSGGGYRLAPLSAGGAVLQGGAYRLTGLAPADVQQTDCCCTYLPCVTK